MCMHIDSITETGGAGQGWLMRGLADLVHGWRVDGWQSGWDLTPCFQAVARASLLGMHAGLCMHTKRAACAGTGLPSEAACAPRPADVECTVVDGGTLGSRQALRSAWPAHFMRPRACRFGVLLAAICKRLRTGAGPRSEAFDLPSAPAGGTSISAARAPTCPPSPTATGRTSSLASRCAGLASVALVNKQHWVLQQLLLTRSAARPKVVGRRGRPCDHETLCLFCCTDWCGLLCTQLCAGCRSDLRAEELPGARGWVAAPWHFPYQWLAVWHMPQAAGQAGFKPASASPCTAASVSVRARPDGYERHWSAGQD